MTEDLSNQTPDSRQTERLPREYSDVHGIDSQPLTTTETDEETLASGLQHSYQNRLVETLQQAIRNGYDGVDVSHLELQSMNGRQLDVWQATKWETEPPSPVEDSYHRYDFRYYDHASLLANLSHGEWPGNKGDVNFRPQK
jgi:hypothetical protein